MSTTYLVWDDETDVSDALTIEAYTTEHAAELWAASKDARGCEYDIASGRWSPVVVVRNLIMPELPDEKFTVTGHAVPEYNAVVMLARTRQDHG